VKASRPSKTLSYFESHAAELAREVVDSGETILITQDGQARLALMDIGAYERQAETLAMLKVLALGRRDIEEGRFREAEEVFRHLDMEGNA
jgi:PHD/YefM family antitoxin component YafN of YafNO toxin-antitoxin module